MIKQSGYKYQIEQALLKNNWEVVEISSNEVWWDDEHWLIQHKHHQLLSFYICYIVDPQFEGKRKKGQGINEIKASIQFPNNWNDTTHEIGSIYMSKRKFNIKLKEFIAELELFKLNGTK